MEPGDNKDNKPSSARWRLKVPWLSQDREIALGDAFQRVASSLGVRPCLGCRSRAAAMNQWLSFGGSASPSARATALPRDGAPVGVPFNLAGASDLVCYRARIAVCAAFAHITEKICDVFAQVTKFVCDVLGTLTQTICDAFGLIAQTVCDVTGTVTHTVCAATQTVCDTICDATRWLPWPLDDLICTASHVACDSICTATKIVTDTVCVASHIVHVFACIASHIVSTIVCLVGHIATEAVCLVGHIVQVIFCILWSVILAIICVVLKILNWIRCLLVAVGRGIFRFRRGRRRIKHVFVLMLENRSFDHMLGFSGIQGVDPVTGAATAIDGLAANTESNPEPGSPNVHFAATPADYKLSKKDTDPGHEFENVLKQLCYDAGTDTTPGYSPGGPYPPITKKGFVADYVQKGDPSNSPRKVMDCYGVVKGGEQISVLTALAREFAVCDRWFSSLPGPTWPNRFFVHAASSGGLDDSPGTFATATSTLINGYAFENGTIFDRLDFACLPWRVYHGDALPQVFAIAGMNLNRLQGKLRSYDEFAEDVNERSYDPVYTFIEPNYGNILPTTSEDFTCGNSQHPLDDVTRGEKLIKDVYEKIRNSPHWENSVLVITYDEHGGFFDHLTPPHAVPPGDAVSDPANVHHGFTFDRLGVRVPAVVVSPLIPKGTVDHTVYDHASVLASLERVFGLKPLTKRDFTANDFLHLLSLASPRADTPAHLPAAAQSGYVCEDD